MGKEITVDIGDLCTHCGRDTSFGSVDHNGEELLLFVNRIPSGADGKLMLSNIESEIDGVDVTVDGYLCIDCQSVECDKCGELSPDYIILDGQFPELLCDECSKKV